MVRCSGSGVFCFRLFWLMVVSCCIRVFSCCIVGVINLKDVVGCNGLLTMIVI